VNEDCCDADLLTGPCASPAARALAVRGFVASWQGDQPPITELAVDDDATIETLVLAGRLQVEDSGRLVGVHGLVARPTAHRIEHAAGVTHTLCALDAIGIPAALGIDAIAATSCPTCGAELKVVLRGGAPVGADEYRLWIPGGQCVHLVEDFCRHANLFCSDEHLGARQLQSTGRAVTVADWSYDVARSCQRARRWPQGLNAATVPSRGSLVDAGAQVATSWPSER
jgi:hypothetical protein